MALYLLQIVIFKVLFSTVLSNYVYQYPTSYPQQYHQAYSKPVTPYKTFNYQPYKPPNFVYPKPEVPQPILKPPILEPTKPIVPLPPIPEEKRKPFDTNVLNNLAIALQLLIVSNIINNPPAESNPSLDSLSCKDVSEKSIKSIMDGMPDFRMPSSNFLETEPLGYSYPKQRSGGLMSPYEAMNTNSFPDLAKFNAMKDFQSPYSAILAFDNNRDLFSMSDLF